MKKKFLYSALFLMGMAFTGFTAVSCNDDEDGGNGGNEFDEAANLNYTPENAASWRNYSLQVAKLLQTDATTLYDGRTAYRSPLRRRVLVQLPLTRRLFQQHPFHPQLLLQQLGQYN